MTDPQVLVVGAGPTGLTAAVELARRGVAVRVVDAAPAAGTTSRALVVQSRTLEVLDGMGLAGAAAAEGRRADLLTPLLPGRAPVRVDLGVEEDRRPDLATAHPHPLVLTQDRTERLLEGALRDLGGTVERGVALEDLAQDDERVRVRLRRAGGRVEHAGAAYVVGADGAHSAVRRLLGVPFTGGSYEAEFLQADVRLEWDLPDGELYVAPHATGFLAAWSMPGPGRFRVFGTAVAPAGAAGPATTEDVQALLDLRSPVPARVVDTTWVTRYRLHHRVADRYRVGRALLAGDAAHVHSPAGAQGMNTGIQDAHNLAWKLAGTVDGGPPALLDSYEPERRPVGVRLLRSTDRMFTLAASGAALPRFLRGRVLPRVMGTLLTRPEFRRVIVSVVSQLAIRYPDSPLTAPDVRRLRGGPGPGSRAPEAPLAGPGHLHDLLRGTGWTALVFAGQGDPAAAVGRLRAAGLRTVTIGSAGAAPQGTGPDAVDGTGLAHHRYAAGSGATYLIRPDGYVAARAAGTAVEPVLAHARAVAGRTAGARP